MASNELTVNGISLSMIHPKYLHSNSTSHPWALGAIAELIDNAYDPDVEAKHLYIDKMERDGHMCLTFQDDGNGMDLKKLHKLLSFGYCDKTSSDRTNSRQPIGQYGNGFKSGTMRLGKDVIVFTRCETSASVGFLSQTYLKKINAESVLVPLLEYKVPTLTPIQRAGWESNLEAILEYSLYKSEEDLVVELRELKAGTKIVIFNLKKINGKYELEFKKSDIRCPVTYMTESNKNEERPLAVSSDYRRSLKEYYSILYYRPNSTNMEVFIRGSLVKLKLMSKTLKEREKQYYKPKCKGEQIGLSIGFAPDEDTEDYGMLLYHKNRLIKAYERVGCQKQANEKGVGVIIVANVDFLTPTHTKQDFELDAKYNSLVGVFAKKVNDFWKKKREKSDPAKGFRSPSKRPSGSLRATDNSHASPEATSVHHDPGSPADVSRESADMYENTQIVITNVAQTTLIKTEMPDREKRFATVPTPSTSREDPDDTIIISDDDDEDSRETVRPEALETTTFEAELSVENHTTMRTENVLKEKDTESFSANLNATSNANVCGQALGVSTTNPTNTLNENLSGQALGVSTTNSTNTLNENLSGQALERSTTNPTNTLNKNLSERSSELPPASTSNTPTENVNVSPSELRRSSRTQKKRQRSVDSEENDIGAKTSEDETPMAKKRSVNTRKPMRSKTALRKKFVKKSKTPNLKAHQSKAATITAKHKRLRSRRAAKNYRPSRTLQATHQATPPAEKNDAEVQTDETTSSKTTPFHYKVFRFLKSLPQLELPANICVDDVENFIFEQNEKSMTTNSSAN